MPMATITVTINEADIMSEIRKAASFEARVARDNGADSLYDTVRITDQDESIIQVFLRSAKQNIVANYPGIAALAVNDIVYTISSDAALTGIDTTVGLETINYIINYCCRRWFAMRYPTKIQEYQDRAALNILNLNGLLYARKAPSVPAGDTAGFIPLTEQSQPNNS